MTIIIQAAKIQAAILQAARRSRFIMAVDESADLSRSILALRSRLSQIKHDANNPLAIVSGNAQLLEELADSQGLTEFLEPLQDIQDACGRVEAALNLLVDVQHEMDRMVDDPRTDLT